MQECGGRHAIGAGSWAEWAKAAGEVIRTQKQLVQALENAGYVSKRNTEKTKRGFRACVSSGPITRTIPGTEADCPAQNRRNPPFQSQGDTRGHVFGKATYRARDTPQYRNGVPSCPPTLTLV
jgi:hypothetical protein